MSIDDTIYCYDCGAIIPKNDLKLFTCVVNGHPGTSIVCKLCIEKYKFDSEEIKQDLHR